jgi:hypothetical protein
MRFCGASSYTARVNLPERAHKPEVVAGLQTHARLGTIPLELWEIDKESANSSAHPIGDWRSGD